jgi:tetratricopeptide (TPR) repeat protein
MSSQIKFYRAKKTTLLGTISLLYIVLLYYIGVVFFANLSYNHALTLEKRGRWLDAIFFYEKAISIYPKDVTFFERLGRLYFYRSWFPGDKGNYLIKAKTTLEQGLSLCSQDGELWLSLGMVWEKLLSKKEALASYSRAIALDPQNAFYRATLANFYFKEGMEAEGIVEARNAISSCSNANTVDDYLKKMGVAEETLKKIKEGFSQ